jgi:iron complex outermembrane recepter protein
MTSKRPALVLLGLVFCSADACAQSIDDDPVTLDRIRVQATRLLGVGDFDTPASASTVELGDDDNGNAVEVSDALGGVPGLLARDRQNYAQDTQLSIRGFGARSTFGVRGVRLFSDGIPASMPDGQGQLSHFNVLGGERIEMILGGSAPRPAAMMPTR